ncbi:diguanylate cyclase [Arcobacter caeni]|uniref:diguanylate cyclase n=1 Tax=Arcobacter caeni TaxID=1912877 RepID=UPI001056FEDF|nr:transporter substrate-binding domain-containing protein [Arcobacter caeni]
MAIILVFLFSYVNIFAQEKTDFIPFVLTQNEKDWLSSHPIIKVGVDKDYAPYEWLENNEYKGVVIEYLRLIEKVIGIKFQIVTNKSWDEIINLAKDGKIDMITSITNTPERNKYLNFTQYYRSSPVIIIDNGKNSFIAGLKYLNNKKVSVEKSYFMEELLENNYPNIKLEVVNSTKEALELTNIGKVDAYVGDVGLADNIIKKYNFSNLRFSGQTEYFSNQGFAVTKNNVELLSILNKAVKSLPEDEIQKMFNYWLNVDRGIDVKTIIFYALGTLFILLVVIYWIYRLRSEITQRKIVENKLKESETLYRQLTEDINDVIWKINTNFIITYISPSDERFRGYKASEVIGKSVFELFTDESIFIIKKEIKERLESLEKGIRLSPFTIELQHKCKDGSIIWGEILSKQEMDIEGNIIGYHGVTREITKRKELQEKIEQLAYRDSLTKLPNRRSLNDKMSFIMSKSERSQKYCALVFIDLDNFKPLNDTYGHNVGDLLLIEVANRLKNSIRKLDVVARLGGDEFVIVFDEFDENKDISKENIFKVVEKIRIYLSQAYEFNIINEKKENIDIKHYCTASIGVCMFKGEQISSLNIFRCADSAMYEAKESGRNTIKFYELVEKF